MMLNRQLKQSSGVRAKNSVSFLSLYFMQSPVYTQQQAYKELGLLLIIELYSEPGVHATAGVQRTRPPSHSCRSGSSIILQVNKGNIKKKH